MRKRLFIALPLAFALMAGSALWVGAAEDDSGIPACADIIGGHAEYAAPTTAVPDVPGAGWTNPGSFFFVETLAAPTCVDVQYGIAVLAADPLGGAPTVLSSQVVPGDGISDKINFDLEVTTDPAQEAVCIYLYTLGASGETTTTPSNGNPHSQPISSGGSVVLDRAPDGVGGTLYCNEEGGGSGGRSYN